MERIVVGIDGSPAAADAARFAVEEGRVRGWPVTAVLCWTYPGRHGDGPPPPGDDGRRPPSSALDRLLASALGEAASGIDERVDEVDFAVAGLLRHVDARDLLVLGPASRNLTHGLVRGSITQRCLQQAPCPVAVVHERASDAGSRAPQKVVVGVDGSSTSRAALRWGIAEARARELPLEVVHAWQVPVVASYVPIDPRDPVHRRHAQEEMDRILAALPRSAQDVEVRPVLVEGPPATVLLGHSDDGDLVVLGTTGIGGVAALLLGSTALRVSQTASHPVVLVPDPA